MLVKFECTTEDKKTYYEIKEKVNYHRGTFIRENVRDLKDDFFARLEVLVHGRTLYRELKESGLCKTISVGIPM